MKNWSTMRIKKKEKKVAFEEVVAVGGGGGRKTKFIIRSIARYGVVGIVSFL